MTDTNTKVSVSIGIGTASIALSIANSYSLSKQLVKNFTHPKVCRYCSIDFIDKSYKQFHEKKINPLLWLISLER